MILIVESNFVLELAFQREEVGYAEQIIDLASKREIDLAVPACALFEPFETLIRRRNARTQTLRSFREQVRELGRSAHFAELDQAFEGVTRVMTNSVETEAVAPDGTIRRILDCADIIPLADEILGSSFGALNCKVLSTFSDAVGRLQHRAKAH